MLKQLRDIEGALFPDLVGVAGNSGSTGSSGSGEVDISGTGDEIHSAPAYGVPGSPSIYGGKGSAMRTVGGASGTTATTLSYNNTDHMQALMLALLDVDADNIHRGGNSDNRLKGKSVVTGHPTLGEWWFWVSRALALVACLWLVAFLFLHDY